MTDRTEVRQPPADRPPRFQFRLRTLLVVTLLFAVLFMVMAGLLREGLNPEKNPKLLVFIVLAVAAPLAMMMLASFVRPLSELVEKLRRRRE